MKYLIAAYLVAIAAVLTTAQMPPPGGDMGGDKPDNMTKPGNMSKPGMNMTDDQCPSYVDFHEKMLVPFRRQVRKSMEAVIKYCELDGDLRNFIKLKVITEIMGVIEEKDNPLFAPYLKLRPFLEGRAYNFEMMINTYKASPASFRCMRGIIQQVREGRTEDKMANKKKGKMGKKMGGGKKMGDGKKMDMDMDSEEKP